MYPQLFTPWSSNKQLNESMKNLDIVENDKSFDLKKVFFRALRYWYIFPIFFIVAVAIALIAYKTTIPQYQISTQVMISEAKDGQTGPAGVSDKALPGIMLGGYSHVENQLIILTSRHQIEKTIRQLDFEVSYYEKELLRYQEIYMASPFKVIIDSSEVVPRGKTFNLVFTSKDKFELELDGSGKKKEYKFFEKIIEPNFVFTIIPVEENLNKVNYWDKSYRFTINHISSLVSHFKGKIFLDQVGFSSSIVEISIHENNIAKGVDFLNKLAQNSVDYTLDKKNQIALNTIEFIEKQLIGVADSLGAAESILENFRSSNVVMDVSFQGQMIITQSKELEEQRAALMAKLDYYSYLSDYINQNRDLHEVVVPASMGIEDPILTGHIAQLSQLNSERSALLFNATTQNPNIARINASIENVKNNILESLRSVIAATNLSLNDINNRLVSLSQDIRKLPHTEQRLLNIERTRQMNNETYTFLLNKLTEAQLAKAANRPDNEIIEPAMVKTQVSPDLTKTILLIFVLGIFLPAIIIFVIVFTNDKVQDKEDITSIAQLPIIGEIPFERNKTAPVNIEPGQDYHGNTILAEAFRSVRTSLGYYANDKGTKVILITSTLPGEGKSFCALNLARSFARLNKRTLLAEYDMRRPSLATQAGIKVDGPGLSSYYTGEAKIEDIMMRDRENENLSVIFAGFIPPNPAELIAGEATARFMEEVSKKFDIVIIDTPPIGVVADALLLTSYADVNIITVRHNTTPKPVLRMNLMDEKVKNIPHLSVLLNGIPSQSREYNYKYSYGNGKYFADAK